MVPDYLTQVTAEQLVHMPQLPARLSFSEHEEALTTDQSKPASGLIQRRLAHLYEPRPIDPDRREELETLAEQLTGERSLTFWTQEIDGDAIQANETIPPYIKRYIHPGATTVLEVMGSFRRAALEQAYADRAITLAHELLQQYLPEFAPKEPTVAVSASFDGKLHASNTYSGKFAGKHVVTLLPPLSTITLADIEAMDATTDRGVVSGAHELLHQAHAEALGKDVIQIGLSDTKPYNINTTEDPYVAFQVSEDYMNAQTNRTPTPADKVISMVTEVIAYAGEEELRTLLGLNTSLADMIHGEDYEEAVDYFLSSSDSKSRRQLMAHLLRVDIDKIGAMSEADLQAVATNPAKLLDLPVRDNP